MTCELTFSFRLGGLKRLHRKILSQDETFHIQSQDIMYKQFITLAGSRQNGTEFYLGQPG